jgi:hypothetical protein
MTMTKINNLNGKADRLAEFIKSMSASERTSLADSISAAAEHMTPAERKQLVEVLSEAVRAEESKKSMASVRAAKLNAALKSTDRKDEINIKTALRSMQRLGLDINEIAASADVKAVEAAMAKQHWQPLERMQLKTTLANLGVID